MPKAVKLSKRFYERFGHEATGELVDWLNAMQANMYAYFDQVVQGHVAQLRAEMRAGFSAQDAKIEARFAKQEANLEARFAKQDINLERRFAEFESKLNRHLIACVLAIIVPLVALVWQSFQR